MNGQRLNQLRRQAGITMTELARRSGLSQGYISRLEMGQSTPSLRVLARLAQALGVPLAILLNEPDRSLLSQQAGAVTYPADATPEDRAILEALPRLNKRHKQGLMTIIEGILEANDERGG